MTWNNDIKEQDLRDVFELALQYISNSRLENGYNLIKLSNNELVIFVATASKEKNDEISEIIEEWMYEEESKETCKPEV